MKIARIAHEGLVNYAVIEGELALPLAGDLFGAWRPGERALPLAEAKLLAPAEPRQVIAVGLNYREHARETGAAIPGEPVIFLKGVNALAGPGDDIVLPAVAPGEVDYECELAIVIGRRAKNVPEAEAKNYILGYTCANDVSARDCQKRRDRQWARAKSFDTFAPLGPWLETDLDPDNLLIRTILNGRTMQESTTADMIFSCARLVSFISCCMTIYPGSVILTGTPPGVGDSRTPPVYLKAGDEVTVEIEGIGRLTNRVVRE